MADEAPPPETVEELFPIREVTISKPIKQLPQPLLGNSFVKRRLKISFGLATGNFASGKPGLTSEGLRISAKIVRAGDTSMSSMTAAIYGMPLETMNQLSTLGMRMNGDVTKNTVILEAGQEGGAMAIAFKGNVIAAWFDGQSQPQVAFRIEAFEGGADAAYPIPATSQPGNIDVATLLGNLAKQADPPLTFENNGVNVKISNPYFSGTVRTQIYEVIQAANIFGGIVEDRKLSIWPRDGSRSNTDVIISPKTGMVAYPSYTEQGIIVKTLYNPNIVHGGKITVKDSELTNANGPWTVGGIVNDLESMVPHGSWFSTVSAYPVGLGPFVPALPKS